MLPLPNIPLRQFIPFPKKVDHHAIALICGNRSISYGELDHLVEQLTRTLQQSGILPGMRVGLAFARSVELIVSLLAVIRCGACYLPLDPAYPAARLEHMVASSGIDQVLTLSSHRALFPKALVIDSAPPPSSDIPILPYHIQEQDPIYAIFTSGSTGEPKAASVFHHGFQNLLNWYRTELSLGPSDVTLVISSPSFDLTQKNLFTPLLTGGTLLLDENLTYDISRILQLIRDHRVTLINCTPSAFYPLVDAAASENFAALHSLRFAVLGGEPISIPRLRTWLEHPQTQAEVVNSYGPTECTDICLFHRLHRQNLDAFEFVPLGREIPNVHVTIRDENLHLLPDGEIGELCIEGAGVGGGYLNQPELTRERFVNGIYRSGDLARKLPCGTFEFRGRADHQIKINGFRIELGEIEIVLGKHDQVREVIVTPRDHLLIAHVRGDVTASDLKAYASERLPAYMVPGEFRFVTSFPLTPNGKIDRRALTESIVAKSEISALADDSLQSRILTLWSEILGTPTRDADANFFDIGGNSILLAVVHVRLKELIQRDFPITDLFAYPSARGLAQHLSPQTHSTGTSSAQDRARLAKAGFSRFQRPSPR